MASPVEIRQLVRFQISQLRVENAHHKFEDICREIARLRIASNILPATGPVGVAGDQGRDFETFRTYLTSSLGETSGFLGLADDRAIAFACTLKQDALGTKVKSDIASITSQGVPVDAIYVFCAKDVPVGTRHEWQEWARDNHGVHLELLDGAAIASHLTDSDTIWIAQSYLSLPSEIVIAVPTDEAGLHYEERREWWDSATTSELTLGDFSDLKRQLRYATAVETRRMDIDLWCSKLRQFINGEAPPQLQRAARYEIVVANLRGRNDLRGLEPVIRDFFANVSELESPSELEDVQVLLMYLSGAIARELPVGVATGEINAWRDALLARAQSLAAQVSGTRKAQHLSTVAFTQLIPDFSLEQPLAKADLELAVKTLIEVLEIAAEEPFFPIDHVASLVSIASWTFVDHPDYRTLVNRLDQIVASRSGRSAAAGQCRDRALALRNAGRLTASIRELQQAKIDWLAGDTIRGSFLAMTIIADSYSRLGLRYAAKYYYLSVGAGALKLWNAELFDMASPALVGAAEMDYLEGAWLGAAELLSVGLILHANLDEDAWNFETHEHLNSAGLMLSNILAVARKHRPSVLSPIESALEELGLREMIEDVIGGLGDHWTDLSEDEVAEVVSRELPQVPYVDAAERRTISWRALGILWTVEFPNTYHATQVAERFVSVAQILLADLAGIDLGLLSTSVTIKVDVLPDSSDRPSKLEDEPSNEGRVWRLDLKPNDDALDNDGFMKFQTETLGVVLSILQEVSVFPDDAFGRQTEELVKGGILHKISPGATFDNLFAYVLSPDQFTRDKVSPTESVGVRTDPDDASEELDWVADPAPMYSSEKAVEFLENRYKHFADRTVHTLAALVGNAQFQASVRELRAEGWLDWQILGAVFSIAMNYRLNLGNPPQSREEFQARMMEYGMEGVEPADAPFVPISEFTIDDLRQAEAGNATSSLQTWGLVLRQRTPDLPAIKNFLIDRLGYWSDDIDHEDFFNV